MSRLSSILNSLFPSTCTGCGDTYVDDWTDPLDHTWGDWGVILDPTCTADGVADGEQE